MLFSNRSPVAISHTLLIRRKGGNLASVSAVPAATWQNRRIGWVSATMSRLHPQNPPGVWLICGVAIWLATFVSVRARAPLAQAVVPTQAAAPAQVPAPAPAQVPVPKPPAPGPATFVGDKVCLDCHDEWQRGVVGSPHSRGVDPRSPAATHGCETCHGEGSKHSDDPTIPIKIFAKMLPREINETCATCHNRGNHALWDGSQHEPRARMRDLS